MLTTSRDGAQGPAARFVGILSIGSFWPEARIRRPVDIARLLVAAACLTALIALAATEPGSLKSLAAGFPVAETGAARTALSITNVVASFALLGILIAPPAPALRTRPFALTSAVPACAVAFVGVSAISATAGLTPDSGVLTTLIETPREAAGLPVTMALALVVGTDLKRSRWAAPARWTVAVAIGCALGLGSLTVPSAAFAILIGAASALAVRATAGVVPARPSADLVQTVLRRAGWEPIELEPVEETAGRTRYRAILPADADLRITVVDPDRRGVPLASRAWRLIRIRTAATGRPALSLGGQLEQQALTGALTESAGVAGPRTLALLPAGNALMLVEKPLAGTPLTAADGPAKARGLVDAWAALRRLHDAGLAHGAATADALLLVPGGAGFADLQTAQPAATELQRDLDAVTMLVSTAADVGAPEAVTALGSGYDTDAPTDVRLSALLQPLALPHGVRRAARGTSLLEDLRAALARPGIDVAVPAPGSSGCRHAPCSAWWAERSPCTCSPASCLR